MLLIHFMLLQVELQDMLRKLYNHPVLRRYFGADTAA